MVTAVRHLAAWALAVGLTTGCTTEDPSTDPTPTGSGGETQARDAAERLCGQVTNEQVSEWTGTPVSIRGDMNNGAIECTAIVDADDGHGLTWLVDESLGSFETDIQSERLPGSKRQNIRLRSGAPAALLTARHPYEAATVLTKYDHQQVLTVRVFESSIGTTDLTLQHLVGVAENVANAYSRA